MTCCICCAAYQKYITPSVEDDVWRLRGIAKDGKICRRLADHQIYKVKDFLHMYHRDQSLLRNVRTFFFLQFTQCLVTAFTILNEMTDSSRIYENHRSFKFALRCGMLLFSRLHYVSQAPHAQIWMVWHQIMSALNPSAKLLFQVYLCIIFLPLDLAKVLKLICQRCFTPFKDGLFYRGIEWA